MPCSTGELTRFTVSVGIELRHAVLEVPIVYAWTRELEFVLYGKSYITWIRASYTWQYVKRNILPRFYGVSYACANSGARAQAVFSLPRKKRPGNKAKLSGTTVCLTGARVPRIKGQGYVYAVKASRKLMTN